MISGELAKRLRQLSDYDVGKLLEGEVFSNLNLLAPEAMICLVAADRLRAAGEPQTQVGTNQS
ncbi:MAG TPA: hypothetical protein VEK33_02310 [Terriglobales bacterium]|nr:hypothetical protein [Terriglobales bacterium]